MKFVCDTAALFAGLPLIMPGEHYTTPLNVAEVKDKESQRVLKMAIESGRLIIKEPSVSIVREVKRKVIEIGEVDLSTTDVYVLALAYELKGILLTDDYALQNAASHLGLRWERVRDKGINKKRRYVIYCPACKREYVGRALSTCPYCGAKLKKRVVEEGEIA